MKIKKLSYMSSLILVLVIVGLMVVAGCAPTPAPEVTEWRIQSCFPRGDITADGLTYFAERVEERSNGRLKVEAFAEPEIVPVTETLPACTTGAIDMAGGAGAVWSMVVPCADVYFGGLPRIWYSPDLSVKEGALFQRKFLSESGAVEIIRDEFAKHNIYWLDMSTAGSVCCLTTKEAHTLDDIKGRKIADLGGWMSRWNAALGWTPVEMLPGSEVEMGLRLGTIDAVLWGQDAMTSLHWNEAAPYWISNEWLVTHILQDLLVNMDSWNALPDDLKQVVEDAADDYFWQQIDAFTAQQKEVYRMVAAGEVTENLMDEEYQRQADKEAYKLWDQAAAEDPASAELIRLIKEARGIA